MDDVFLSLTGHHAETEPGAEDATQNGDGAGRGRGRRGAA